MTWEWDRTRLAQHFGRLVDEHGDAPEAAQWSDLASQDARLAVLCEVGDLTEAKILDFGCGTGRLLAFLREHLDFRGEYVGYDLAEQAIAKAQCSFPSTRFERRDVLEEGLSEDFDYVVASGVFSYRVSDNWRLMTDLLPILFERTRAALAFNAISTYVDYFDDDLFYVDPERVFAFCKEKLSPAVTLRHDYRVKADVPPFEFTVYVRRMDEAPRARLGLRGK